MNTARVPRLTQYHQQDPALARWESHIRNTLNPALAVMPQKRQTVQASINIGTLATATVYESAAIPCTGALENDFVLVGAPSTFPAGCLAFGYVSSPGNVKVRVLNSSGGNVTPGAQTYSITTVAQ